MIRLRRFAASASLLLLLVPVGDAFAQTGTHLVIVVGLSGDPEHGELFK
jgi:hypothetical protein